MTIQKADLPNRISIITETHESGDITSSTKTGVYARIASRRQKVTSAEGEHYENVSFLFLLADETISFNSKCIVEGLTRKIKTIVKARDGEGNVHHLEVGLA